MNLYQVIYAFLSFLGAVILQMGADSISKLMQQKMGKDRWNVEEESFDQNQELVQSDTSINIPYIFWYGGKSRGVDKYRSISWNNGNWRSGLW